MKYRALLKDTAREIWKTRSRFLSIFAIVMLGVGFFAGVKATCPDMKLTAETYYKDRRLMDYRLVSTYGFDGDDAEAVRNAEGVRAVMPQYSGDFLSRNGENDVVIRAYSVDGKKAASDDADNLNRLVLTEGRWPVRSGECLIEDGVTLPEDFCLGSTITLFSGTDAPLSDTLAADTFTVVGVVESPLYISFERGSSTIGNGSVVGFILLPEEDFVSEVYTDLYVTLDETAELSPFSDAYKDVIEAGSDGIRDTALEAVDTRYRGIVSDKRKELDDAKNELEEVEKEQKEALDEAEKEIREGRLAYNNAYVDYWKEHDAFVAAVDRGRRELEKGAEELSENRASYEELKELFKTVSSLRGLPAGEPLDETAQEVVRASAALDESFPALLTAALATGDPAAAAALDAALEQTKVQLDGLGGTLDAAEAELEEKKAELSEREEKGFAQLAAAKRTIDRTYLDLEKAQTDYDKAKAEFKLQIEEARAEIEDGEKALDELEPPKVYLFDRTDNAGYPGFEHDAERVDAIARIFPVFFLFVAALVCLTTMTRMVEEERTEIGTMKALGYGRGAIVFKYLIYAFAASFFGSVTGLLIGFQLFPRVIYGAYRIMYKLPPLIAPFRFDYAVWCTLAAMLVTGAATLFACYAELSAVPSQLMRPKPPKSGKRILLERVRFLWSRISFIRKVTIRNFFRYKKRIVLTITGIAGCTALMLTGFGLKDSISSIVDRQYQEIFHYDAMTVFDAEPASEEWIALEKTLSGRGEVEQVLYASQSSVDGKNPDSGETVKNCYLLVPREEEALKRFVSLRSYGDGEEIAPQSESPDGKRPAGVVITAKLARTLGLSVGDEIVLEEKEGETVTAGISGVAENYVFHYIYMLPESYEALYGEDPKPNVALLRLTEEGLADTDPLSSAVLKNDAVLQVSFSTEIGKTFSDIIERLNTIVLVLILSAGALALIVLYNLISINVNERIRELATLKVLGFYNKEVSSYISRESVASSLIGILFGLGLGVLLHRFVITTAEVDIVMFSREIYPLSFVAAAALTFAFTLLVNFLLRFRLRKIDMVESLKSVE